MRTLRTKAAFELVSVYQRDVSFRWKSAAQVMNYFFGQGNPIASQLYKGTSHEDLKRVKPAFEQVFEEDHPDPMSHHEVAIIAIGWKR